MIFGDHISKIDNPWIRHSCKVNTCRSFYYSALTRLMMFKEPTVDIVFYKHFLGFLRGCIRLVCIGAFRKPQQLFQLIHDFFIIIHNTVFLSCFRFAWRLPHQQ